MSQMSEIESFKVFRNRWVAVDTRGGAGLATLRNGAVVVDYDSDVGDLCARLETDGRSSVEVVYCTC